jgi:hypothetical protein
LGSEGVKRQMTPIVEILPERRVTLTHQNQRQERFQRQENELQNVAKVT